MTHPEPQFPTDPTAYRVPDPAHPVSNELTGYTGPPAPPPFPGQQPPQYGQPQFGQPQFAQPQFGQPQQQVVVTAPKSAGIAILLSLLWFGAGHLYANQSGVGIALIVYDVFLAILSITVFGLIISIPLWLLSLPVVLITAANAANAYNQRNGLVVR